MNDKKQIKRDIEKALANENLRGALGRFGDDYVGLRERAYTGKNFEELRNQIASIKGGAAERMEELAQRFTVSAQARGAKVFHAGTAREAKEYIKI